MSNVVSYPKQVWYAIRVIWENCPSMGYVAAINTVKQLMKVDAMPTASIVGRRAKKEGWKKITSADAMSLDDELSFIERIDEILKQSDDEIEKLFKIHGKKNKVQKNDYQDVVDDHRNDHEYCQNDCQEAENDHEHSHHAEKTTQNDHAVKENDHAIVIYQEQPRQEPKQEPCPEVGRESVISQRRAEAQDIYNVGKLIRKRYRQYIEQVEPILSGSYQIDENTYLESELDEDAFLKIKVRLNLFKEMININEAQARTHNLLNQSSKDLWGIEIDDVRGVAEADQVEQAEIDRIKLEMKVRQAEELSVQKQKDALHRQLEIIKQAEILAKNGGVDTDDELD